MFLDVPSVFWLGQFSDLLSSLHRICVTVSCTASLLSTLHVQSEQLMTKLSRLNPSNTPNICRKQAERTQTSLNMNMHQYDLSTLPYGDRLFDHVFSLDCL